MPREIRSPSLDAGLQHAIDNSTHVRLVNAYAAGDSFATVGANTIATIAFGAGVSFSAIADITNGRRTVLSVSGLTVATAHDGLGDLHLVMTNNTLSSVTFATDETSDRALLVGDVIQDFTVNVDLTYTP